MDDTSLQIDDLRMIKQIVFTKAETTVIWYLLGRKPDICLYDRYGVFFVSPPVPLNGCLLKQMQVKPDKW